MSLTKIWNQGLQAAYDALETKDSNKFYVCTDTQRIYKGDQLYVDALASIDPANLVNYVEDPYSESITQSGLYIATGEFTDDMGGSHSYGNNIFFVDCDGDENVVTQLTYPTTDSINEPVPGLPAVVIDKLVTEQAIINYVTSKLEANIPTERIIEISEGQLDGTIDVIKETRGAIGSTETTDIETQTVTIKGVVTTPTWDATTRKLTLPVNGSTAVEVNLGKDIFVDTTADNKFNPETGNIELYLNDGSEGSEPTLISIPAASLIDVYTGEAGVGTTTAVSDDNKIKVDLVIDPAEDNLLAVGENGLKVTVDLSGYATTIALETAKTEAKSYTDTALGQAKTYADDAVAASLEWGTF